MFWLTISLEHTKDGENHEVQLRGLIIGMFSNADYNKEQITKPGWASCSINTYVPSVIIVYIWGHSMVHTLQLVTMLGRLLTQTSILCGWFITKRTLYGHAHDYSNICYFSTQVLSPVKYLWIKCIRVNYIVVTMMMIMILIIISMITSKSSPGGNVYIIPRYWYDLWNTDV